MNLRVLFIGNSHTYLNYMPLMLMEMVEASGRGLKLETEQSIGESVSLEWHWNNPRTRELMAARGWDFVVLQDRSGGPLENRPSFERYARLLDGEIRRQGGASIFYMTWARKSQPQTQAELNDAYTSIAKELGAMLAPVGTAWQRVRELDPGVELHHSDGRHANPAGSYLAACVFYAVILKASPVGLPASFEIQSKSRPDLRGCLSAKGSVGYDNAERMRDLSRTRSRRSSSISV